MEMAARVEPSWEGPGTCSPEPRRLVWGLHLPRAARAAPPPHQQRRGAGGVPAPGFFNGTSQMDLKFTLGCEWSPSTPASLGMQSPRRSR